MRRDTSSKRCKIRGPGANVRALLRAAERRDDLAETTLCKRFFSPLLRYFRRKFGTLSRAVVAEEDLAQEVMAGLFKEIHDGRFSKVQSWTEVRRFVGLAARNAFAQLRRKADCQKRPGDRNHVRTRPDLDAIPDRPRYDHDPNASDLTHDLYVLIRKSHDDLLWCIVMLREEPGLSTPQIARRLRISERSVNRKLKWLRDELQTCIRAGVALHCDEPFHPTTELDRVMVTVNEPVWQSTLHIGCRAPTPVAGHAH